MCVNQLSSLCSFSRHSLEKLRSGHTHHLLCHGLRDLLLQVEAELDGSCVPVLALQPAGVLHPQLERNAHLQAVILLRQLHPHAGVLREERVIQQVLDGVTVGRAALILPAQVTNGDGGNPEQQIQTTALYSPILFFLTNTLANDLFDLGIHHFVITGRLHPLREREREGD